ncbi:transposase [Nocardia fusca]|uniref:transposase n=1 Tax=Nocardia fusca TaxID=941183 RepID=UPI0037A4447B
MGGAGTAAAVADGGRPEEYCRRQIIDAIFYLADNGCKWRNLSADFPRFLWNLICPICCPGQWVWPGEALLWAGCRYRAAFARLVW